MVAKTFSEKLIVFTMQVCLSVSEFFFLINKWKLSRLCCFVLGFSGSVPVCQPIVNTTTLVLEAETNQGLIKNTNPFCFCLKFLTEIIGE